MVVTLIWEANCRSVVLKQLEFVGQGPEKGGYVMGPPEVHVEIQPAKGRQNSSGLSGDHL